MKRSSPCLVVVSLLVACGGGEEASAPPPTAASEAPPPSASAPPSPPPATVASCASIFGFCDEYAGADWTDRGADDTARAAGIPCRGSTLAIGVPCSREGLLGSCEGSGHVTYFVESHAGTATPSADQQRHTAQASCSRTHGTWVAAP